MKQIAIIILALCFLSMGGAKRDKHEYACTNYNCSYETLDGQFDGKYISFYPNAKKKAEGTLAHNYRTGVWSVWDTSGVLVLQRRYINPFDYSTVFSKDGKKTGTKEKPTSTLKYNEDGYISYFGISEEDVVWAKRIWRFLPLGRNSLLLEGDGLSTVLAKGIQSQVFQPYTDDDFTHMRSIRPEELSGNITIGYRIVEDHFYDNKRHICESRIIGICPVGVNYQSGDTTDLYWLYLPRIRKTLAQQRISGANLPSYIRTLDDLFFFRYFYSQIYKEENINDRPIKAYGPGVDEAKESERIEIELIEKEHDFWLMN
ncbi:MAG TPA: hypothetical protein P5228_06295 [Bacteroidales bacterium]|nr:hypothetical protein [Bacteroidales bacterium]HRZ49059.1 hypothetical protein [Bacteroidales bacterium]